MRLSAHLGKEENEGGHWGGSQPSGETTLAIGPSSPSSLRPAVERSNVKHTKSAPTAGVRAVTRSATVGLSAMKPRPFLSCAVPAESSMKGFLNDRSNNDKENKMHLDEHDRRKSMMLISQLIKKESIFIFAHFWVSSIINKFGIN
ncbi:hypothetical protein M9Y10_039765 [Tritrichomonas musculus]|uniref:Uncharacterized protein n=1 Tax=Tritrichomonas musculus TaxID=1915356 RepID=A0ABR2GRX0_9EUKA